jgi:hypothetical protein
MPNPNLRSSVIVEFMKNIDDAAENLRNNNPPNHFGFDKLRLHPEHG